MTDLITIRSAALTAEISPAGAELRRLQDEAGRDLLWDGDPAFWTGRAPILFPVIGAVDGDVIRVDGETYPMPKHGFARRRDFALIESRADAVLFRLEDDAATRTSYPFAFRLDIGFAIDGAALVHTAKLTNMGDRPLPASFGFHPAFRWPLPWGGARADHRLRFSAPEPAPIRRIDGAGLLRPDPEPSPVQGHDLVLEDALFEDDALIFDQLASRAVEFGAPGTRRLRVSFPESPHLGVWTKPGAGFLCIEPWQGFADPEGYDGPFKDKPGVVITSPGASRSWALRIDIESDTF
jgi:galactose mutarotase-like enzyme